MLIAGPSDLPAGRRTSNVYVELLGVGIPLDVLWWTRLELEERSEVRSHIIDRALRDSKILYEKNAGWPCIDALGEGRE